MKLKNIAQHFATEYPTILNKNNWYFYCTVINLGCSGPLRAAQGCLAKLLPKRARTVQYGCDQSHQLWWTVKWCGCGVAVMKLLGNTVTSSIESAQLMIGGAAGRPTSAISASLATVNRIDYASTLTSNALILLNPFYSTDNH